MTVKSDEVASVMLGCLQFFYKAYRNSVVTVVIMDLLVVNPEDAIDMDLHARALDNEECERQLDYLSNNIDSSARLPSGLLSLNINEFGDYHQCLSINNTVDGITFLGKHCQIMNAAVKPINISTTFEAWCMCAEAMPRSPISKVLHTKTISRSKLRGFLTALFLVTALSTGYDLYQTFVKNVTPTKSLLSSFSVYTNTRRFLTFRKSKSTLECVDGIRALSMFWVIIGHTLLPLLATVVLFQTSIVNWLSDGPDWPKLAFTSEVCKQRWWAVLLHIQNYLKPSGLLYMLSPLVLIFLFGSRKIAWSVMTLTLIASLITVTYYAFTYEIPVLENTSNIFKKIFRSHTSEGNALRHRHHVWVHFEGPINWFLSQPLWKLPSRMSYAAYLVHLPIMMVRNNGVVKSAFFSDIETKQRRHISR
ncbi:unnamed protein product [Leptidea sinapis]|uniref:Nose resistant-to-fluoxetine protein N-terminal domain-containing protein n=1 Tax=Leptidea sinapis TaxID=189913 RepID=A0A5E4R657_9NEOP|nr:unnamed protein product [Leptidea sinapis]